MRHAPRRDGASRQPVRAPVSDEADEALAAHRAALATLRATVGALGPQPDAAAMPDAIAQAGAETGHAAAAEIARMYVFGARVGAAAAGDPERARQWLEGWCGARSRTPDEARAALAAGIAFGERVLREAGAA